MPTETFDLSNVPDEGPTRSSRDRTALREALQRWFETTLPGAEPEVGPIDSPGSTGMSSETLLFALGWTEAGERRSGDFVARVAPDAADVPVFPTYDLEAQYRLLGLLAEHGAPPVPQVRWLEPTTSALGAPFFVMERVSGRVPSDIPPYTMEGWLLDADDDDRRALQDGTVGLLTDLHAIDISWHDVEFLEFDVAGDTPLRRHVENQRRYYDWVRDGGSSPIIDATFEWLTDHWPAVEGETIISWGDSRIGNVLYDGFTPAAALDWEMAGLAVREVDVGWMCFMHTFFQDITEQLGMPGLPELMHPDDVRLAYEQRSGVKLDDLAWYVTYAGLRHAIVMLRVSARAIHFGDAEPSDDVDAAIPHRTVLARMIDGSWWS